MGCKVGMKACTRKLLEAVVRWSVIYFMRVDDNLECILWPLRLLCQSALHQSKWRRDRELQSLLCARRRSGHVARTRIPMVGSTISVVLAALVICGCVTSS